MPPDPSVEPLKEIIAHAWFQPGGPPPFIDEHFAAPLLVASDMDVLQMLRLYARCITKNEDYEPTLEDVESIRSHDSVAMGAFRVGISDLALLLRAMMFYEYAIPSILDIPSTAKNVRQSELSAYAQDLGWSDHEFIGFLRCYGQLRSDILAA